MVPGFEGAKFLWISDLKHLAETVFFHMIDCAIAGTM